MADYVPSAIVMVGSIITIGILYAIRIPPIVIGIIAIFALVYVWARHQDLFATNYRTATLLNTFTSYAPFILVSVVIFMGLGYIFFLRGVTKGPSSAAPAAAVNSLVPSMPVLPSPLVTAANAVKQATTTISTSINRALNSLTNRNRENLFLALERAV